MLGLAMVTRQDISMKSINLAPIVKSIMDDLRSAEPERNVELIIHSNLEAKGDEKLVYIALSNLLGNAWKYTGKVQNPLIEVGVKFREKHKTFFVRDNGVGFDMKYASKLFSPFQRLHPQKEFSGTGVGLAITARVIARHHGRIWAESSPGEGAIFFFELD
jgi:light-regulated signal transduction histidine kinase (bacteriophytochrome)